MLIVNADDWGRCVEETDAALQCFKQGRVTSVSAMVFMRDSERAAELALANGVDAGLHLNFAEPFNAGDPGPRVVESQRKVVGYLMGRKYAQLVYNPILRPHFAWSVTAQLKEFERLYGKPPSHIDGHHHLHLCANMLLSTMLPAGSKIRRNFSFWPGEKSRLNRGYRAMVDRWMGRRHRMTDYFFDLGQSMRENKFDRVAALAHSNSVEMMTHPTLKPEFDFLVSAEFSRALRQPELAAYAAF